MSRRQKIDSRPSIIRSGPIEEPCAFVAVVDRAHLPSTAPLIRAYLGGGWSVGVDLFAADAGAEFLVLVAETFEQVDARTPAVLVCADLQGLRHAVEDVVARLDGRCELLLKLSPNARRVVTSILALEAVTEGSA